MPHFLQTGAIMNPTNTSVNLSVGYVSKAILQQGGDRIQREANSKRDESFTFGKIIVTGGYKLNCRYVFHGACKKWGDRGSQKVRDFIVITI